MFCKRTLQCKHSNFHYFPLSAISSTFCRVAGFEDTGSDEDTLCSELHHQRCIGRRCHTAGREVDNRETAVVMHIQNKIVWNLQHFGCLKQLVLTHRGQFLDFAVHLSHVADSLYDISGSRLTFGTDHRCALVDPAECLAEIFCTADKRYFEIAFVDMVNVIRRGENFALVDVVDFDGFEHLRLYKVTDPAFCHNWDRNGFLDAADHFRIAHTGNAACCTDVCRDTLQRHNGTCTSFLCNMCLLRSGNVHDNAAL